MKAALTSGSLSATGDLLAQFSQGELKKVSTRAEGWSKPLRQSSPIHLHRTLLPLLLHILPNTATQTSCLTHGVTLNTSSCSIQKQGQQPSPYDPSRTLRMFGYGWFLYGPYQVKCQETACLQWLSY